MKKRILGLFFICLMATMLSTTALAENEAGEFDGPLSFGASTEDESNDYYTWDNETATLTITEDMTIVAGNSTGITFDCTGATIVVNDSVKLTISSSKYGIYDDTSTSSDTLTITNNGTIDITTTNYNAIDIEEGSISITGGILNIKSGNDGIYASAGVTIDGGDIDIDASHRGIATYSGNIAITNSADVYVASDYDEYAIQAGETPGSYTLTITGSTVEVVMSSYASDVIYSKGNMTITNSTVIVNDCISSEGSIFIVNSTVTVDEYIAAEGSISIDGDSIVTAPGGIWSYFAAANSITVTAGASITGYTAACMSGNEYAYVIYTAVEDTYGWYIYEGDTLDFKVDASLTILEDITTDLSTCTITWDNANFINNGILILPSTTDYDTAMGDITNNGEVIIGSTAYDADGNTSTAPFYGPLELEEGEAYDGSAYGFEWDETNKILTINSDLTITSTDEGIDLEDGATIVLNANLTIDSDYHGIYAYDGDITISGTGKLTIGSDYHGIYAYDGDITITDATVIDNSDDGIEANGNLEISGSAEVNASDIDADGNITISGSATVNAEGYIYAYGDISIKNATVNASSIDAGGDVEIENSTLDVAWITVYGDITIDATTTGCLGDIWSEGTVAITEGAEIEVYSIYAANGATFTTNDTLNNFAYSYLESEDLKTEIYGEVSLEDGWIMYSYCGDDIIVTEGSTLTIPTGITLDLNAYVATYYWQTSYPEGSLDFSKGTLIVDGVLIYPDDTVVADVDFDSITGDGYIVVDGDYYAVGSTGNASVGTVTGTANNSGYYYLTLGNDSIAGQDYYTWDVVDGVGTLTVSDETVFTCIISIEDVDSAIISVDGKMTATDEIQPYCDLTINGDGTLTAPISNWNNTDNDGTDVLTINATVTGDISWNGELVVNGDLIAGGIYASNMTVNTGATVEITTQGLCLESAEAPTLTLGTDVGIITPADGGYATGYVDWMGDFSTITTDGESPDMENYSNYAYAVSIGYVKTTTTSSGSSSSSSTTTTTGSTTTNDDGSVTASASVSTSTSGSTTTATVTDSKMDTAIETAVDAADGDTAIVEIPVTTKSSTDTVSAVVSADALTAIADSDVAQLDITSDLGTISIPSEALAEIASQASGTNVTITVQYLDADEHLNDAQASVVGDALVIDLIITSDGETITSFGGHEIEVSLPYTLKDGEDAENIVVWYIDDDGIITPLDTVYDAETQTVTFVTAHFSIYAIIHDTNVFEDVDVNAYYYNAVQWAVENGITAGYADGTFGPGNSCTRAQAVTFLWRAAGEPEATITNPFSDLDETAYYYDAVLWAVENGITSGTTDTTFSPDATCNRGQIVTFLYRLAGEPEVSGEALSDVAEGAYYYDAVLWAVENGITTGYTDGTFGPGITCNRGAIVTFLYRYLA